MSKVSLVLLDTSVLIDLECLDLGEFSIATSAVSAVSVAELAYGLDTNDPVQRLVRSERYQAVLQNFPILPFDTAEAKLYGTLAALVRQSGRNPRPRRLDLQIAATASAHSIPLLTTNAADFTGLERLVEVIALAPKS
ncbi:MAG: type II toxin-antitoxin system VapC family toxin [Mycobacteriales bacterium]